MGVISKNRILPVQFGSKAVQIIQILFLKYMYSPKCTLSVNLKKSLVLTSASSLKCFRLKKIENVHFLNGKDKNFLSETGKGGKESLLKRKGKRIGVEDQNKRLKTQTANQEVTSNQLIAEEKSKKSSKHIFSECCIPSQECSPNKLIVSIFPFQSPSHFKLPSPHSKSNLKPKNFVSSQLDPKPERCSDSNFMRTSMPHDPERMHHLSKKILVHDPFRYRKGKEDDKRTSVAKRRSFLHLQEDLLQKQKIATGQTAFLDEMAIQAEMIESAIQRKDSRISNNDKEQLENIIDLLQ